MRITTFAAIYVGSYEVSLKITEISAKRKIREIAGSGSEEIFINIKKWKQKSWKNSVRSFQNMKRS